MMPVWAPKALEGHLVDGLIVVNQIPDATAARLDGMAPPCVWLDSNVWRPERCLRRDEIGAGTLVVEKLVELGYRELILAHPVPDRNHYSFTQRIEGVRQASRRADLELRTVSIEANNFQPLWPQLTPDVAVIFPDIYMARKFGFFMAEMQLAAGRDCAVACCDDDIQVGAQVWGRIDARLLRPLRDGTASRPNDARSFARPGRALPLAPDKRRLDRGPHRAPRAPELRAFRQSCENFCPEMFEKERIWVYYF